MDRDTARQETRRNWKRLFPADHKGKGIICPLCGSGSGKNGTGITENPKAKEPGQLRCWNCGFQGDVIDLIQQNTGADYNTALQMAAADLGITIDPYRQSAAADFAPAQTDAQKAPKNDFKSADNKKPGRDANAPENSAQQPTAASIADYTAYYEKCSRNMNDPAAISYLQARGISEATAAAFHLGYDAAWISPTVIKNQQAKGSDWKPDPTARIIMPVSKNHYVARAISPDVPKDYAKMNETGGGSIGIFNARAVYGEQEAVFVVEGIFDALSIIECGAAAVALNSTSNAGLFIKQLQQEPTAATLILCLDNDDPGKKAVAVIKQGLTRLNISSVTADISGKYKDPNDALTGDRAAFEQAIAAAQKEAAQLPGLLTYTDAVNIFETADDRFIEMRAFPKFTATAKIKVHDTVALAADTGAGKSSLALNFLNDLNGEYPCIYINLEMDAITVLRRLVAINSGMEIDRIEGYKNDEKTAKAVNISLQAITSRKPLQVIQGAYLLQHIEGIIKRSTKGRDEPTIVIIDHSLLVDTQERTGSRYDRFTQVSEGLRKMTLNNNIILFVLLQQNRAGKADDNERPKNSSLKESGSWENDATHICFLWYDPIDRKKKLLLTKNRGGSGGEFPLNYWKKTQTYTEATGGAASAQPAGNAAPRKQTKRERQKQKLLNAYETAYFNTFGKPTLQAIAEAADVTTSTVKTWLREYGGFMVDGKPIDPAGFDAVVEQQGFIKLTPADDNPFMDQEPTQKTAGEYTPGGKI